MTPVSRAIISERPRRPPAPPPPGGGGGPPSWPNGPYLAENSPWRTLVPAGCPIHQDNQQMIGGVYIGTDYTAYDIHAFAYRPVEIAHRNTLTGLHGSDVRWAGPGMQENIIYSPIGQASIPVIRDSPSLNYATVQVPMPFNWTGYNQVGAAYYERRTTVICEDGRIFYLYGTTPPGTVNRDSGAIDNTRWHASYVAQSQQNWDARHVFWPQGGSGFPPLPGTLTPNDFLRSPVGGDLGHALAFNCAWAADGSFTGHPKFVWPAAFVIQGTHNLSDGRTKTAVGIPHGARIFLNPSLTDTQLAGYGITKEWMLKIARTLQRYGGISKESVTGQAGAGGIISESTESIGWNSAHGYYPAGYQWPWQADGTTDMTDKDSTTFNAAFPYNSSTGNTILPPGTSGLQFRVADFAQVIAGITG